MLGNQGPIRSSQSNVREKFLLFLGYPLAKMGLVLPTQPLVNVMVQQQKTFTSFPKSFQVLKQKGASRFFQGTVPSMVREGQKSAYKGWLTANAQDWARNIIEWVVPNTKAQHGSSERQHYSIDLLAGGISGTVDAAFSGPTERYKIYALAQDSKTNLYQFSRALYQQHQHLPLFARAAAIQAELWKGFYATALKQSVMIGAFFVAFTYSSEQLKPFKEKYPNLTKGGIAITSGCFAAFVAAPLDITKTLIQKDLGSDARIFQRIASIYQEMGLTGLTRGVGAKCTLTAVGYGFTALFLNHIKEARNQRLAELEAQEEALTTEFENLSLMDKKPIKPK